MGSIHEELHFRFYLILINLLLNVEQPHMARSSRIGQHNLGGTSINWRNL